MSVCHQRCCLVVTSRQGFRVGVMQEEETYTIGDVAAQFGLTVRTLRYWDQIGLVVPSYRDWQDFRQYTESDMQRIHDVLTYRAVGLKLQAIRELLDDPSGDNADVVTQFADAAAASPAATRSHFGHAECPGHAFGGSNEHS